ncbi:dihydroorotate dehydrogenase electron transfer subunit [Alkaliphilus serpentinus]|uniref:Dihydroorotate dehydrogenase B (NAD(+)), electron transfer subunit n=1 Tax=Alkaliphilus serpentinus TaxID=1482731 RepID=A0A833ME96_9FIRM|nr:dihydroorotate dehydrogenase electron transfer subunit [Alkaliphilus serpentinus]KAB3530560.1 dihydroorotate dehydrogenase electron transfer subunit [Alkaliphilus serpentinus]
MKSKTTGIVLENHEIAKGIYQMKLAVGDTAKEAKVGQFINLYLPRRDLLLPRPISISQISIGEGTFKLVYGVVGKGTKELSKMKEKEGIPFMGPLGNGFKVDEGVKNHILIGGGIGVPPLLQLASELKGNISVYLGFREEPFLVEEFKKYSNQVLIATEDGSYGAKGDVIKLLDENPPEGEMVYSCGPKPMLKAVADWSRAVDINAQLSMEERMACGIGACLVCTCKIKDEGLMKWQNKRVCKDGPVFLRDEVVWND